MKENNELKSEVKNLSNKLERCYNSKISIEQIMSNQRRNGDKSGIGYNKSESKIMKKQDAKKLSQLMCYRCHEMGHIAKCCPTKKPQVEPKAKPQAQIKINHEDGGDLMIKKKKTRRGGRARHPMQIQDAKMMSKNQIKKRDLAHIKCYKCRDMGHFASECPNKLEKKAQVTHERQGNEEHHMSKEGKAQLKRRCYSCRGKGTHGTFMSPR
jgi:hypothetical protein